MKIRVQRFLPGFTFISGGCQEACTCAALSYPRRRQKYVYAAQEWYLQAPTSSFRDSSVNKIKPNSTTQAMPRFPEGASPSQKRIISFPKKAFSSFGKRHLNACLNLQTQLALGTEVPWRDPTSKWYLPRARPLRGPCLQEASKVTITRAGPEVTRMSISHGNQAS